MKIEKFGRSVKCEIISANEIIEANITDGATEIIFEDKSIIIFNDLNQFYSIITNEDYYSYKDNEFDIDKFIHDNIVNSDDVGEGYQYRNRNIIDIEELKVSGDKVYRLLF